MQDMLVASPGNPRRAAPVPILYVRNVPKGLYADLQRIARAHRRSLSAEVLTALERAVEAESRREEHARNMAALRRLLRSQKPLPPGVDSADWIREDRDR